MRAVKRERYGKKELDRLKKTLGIEDLEPSSKEVNMQNITEIVTVVPMNEISLPEKSNQEECIDIMDMSELNDIKKFNTKTLRNENGAYPIWLHPRKIKKAKKANKKGKVKGKITKRVKRKAGNNADWLRFELLYDFRNKKYVWNGFIFKKPYIV